MKESQVTKHGKNILKFFDLLTSDYRVLFCHQFIEYDMQGNRNVSKLSLLQKIKGSDKMFKELADVLL
jgi:hypothetical protein